jgi:hypothetical protein
MGLISTISSKVNPYWHNIFRMEVKGVFLFPLDSSENILVGGYCYEGNR